MVPKIARPGRSFKGAALYYLHDKNALTDERVAAVETVNLPTNDPQRAIAHMIDTATHADELKAEAGLKAGRKLQNPVYTYSLAWHPDQAPTLAHQIDAAKETLNALGITDRQALIVAHTDEEHPHVHVIVNRVCPETGRAANMGNDRLKLSDWALDYERRHGQILCSQREQNQARRAFEFVKDQSLNRKDWLEWKKSQQGAIWEQYRKDRDEARADRKGQYDALWDQKQMRIDDRKAEIKKSYKPVWRDVFRKQKEALKRFDTSIMERISFAFRQNKESKIIGVFRAITWDNGQRNEFIRMQEKERREIGATQTAKIRDAAREINKAWAYDRDQLKALHRELDGQRLDAAKSAADEVWEAQPEDLEARSAAPEITDPIKAEYERQKGNAEERAARRQRQRTRRERGRSGRGRGREM